MPRRAPRHAVSRPGSTLPLAILAALALLAPLAACGRAGEQTGSASPPTAAPDSAAPAVAPPGGPAPAGATAQINLYFPDEQGELRTEKREVSWEGDVEERGRRVVQALLDGPTGAGGKGLTAVVPPDTTLRALYIRDDGIAYVDLDAAFARGLSGGSEDSLLAVWSIADTLAANMTEVQRVKILVEGEEVRDLGGHLDLSRPLTPDMARR